MVREVEFCDWFKAIFYVFYNQGFQSQNQVQSLTQQVVELQCRLNRQCNQVC